MSWVRAGSVSAFAGHSSVPMARPARSSFRGVFTSWSPIGPNPYHAGQSRRQLLFLDNPVDTDQSQFMSTHAQLPRYRTHTAVGQRPTGRVLVFSSQTSKRGRQRV